MASSRSSLLQGLFAGGMPYLHLKVLDQERTNDLVQPEELVQETPATIIVFNEIMDIIAIIDIIYTSGTLCYMISYMISEDSDIDYDIICFEMSMIS